MPLWNWKDFRIRFGYVLRPKNNKCFFDLIKIENNPITYEIIIKWSWFDYQSKSTDDFIKVRNFWETHKIWKNLPRGFDKTADLFSKCQNHEEDFFSNYVCFSKGPNFDFVSMFVHQHDQTFSFYFIEFFFHRPVILFN